MNTLFIFGAKYLFLASIIIFVIYFLRYPDKKRFLRISLAIPLTYLLGLISRALYYNPRPFVKEGVTPLIEHIADNGFPSDHALLVSALAAVVMIFDKRVGLTLWVVAILVATSRVYVGVHHVLDVSISILLSVVAVWMVYFWNKSKNYGTPSTTPE